MYLLFYYFWRMLGYSLIEIGSFPGFCFESDYGSILDGREIAMCNLRNLTIGCVEICLFVFFGNLDKV